MNDLPQFPQGTYLMIDVIYEGEYRVGFRYGRYSYNPGSGSYYPLDVAMWKAYKALIRLTNNDMPPTNSSR